MMTRILGVCAGVALALLARPAAADNVELRFATLAPQGSPWMKILDEAAAEIKEKTAGRVTLKYFPGGSQGDEKDFIRKINAGQLDGAAITSVGLSLIEESIRVLELPMMFQSPEEVDYVADKVWPYFQKKFEAKGWKLNDRGEIGWIYFISKDKVETAADLKGQKIWQWGDDAIVGAMFKKLGLNGVPLGVPEVDSSLTSGRITAAYAPPAAALSLQWYSKIKFMTSMPLSFGIGATVLSSAAVKKLTPDDVKTIEQVTQSYAKKLRKQLRKANEEALTTMARKGVTVIKTPAATVDEFTKAAAAVQQELSPKVYSKAELDMVIKARDEFRAKKAGK